MDCFVASLLAMTRAASRFHHGRLWNTGSPAFADDDVGVWRVLIPSLRANGSRECAPDDRLREAIHSRRDARSWIAHMGNVCVKDEQSPFCSTAAAASFRPRAVQDDARRLSQGRPVRGAAERL